MVLLSHLELIHETLRLGLLFLFMLMLQIILEIIPQLDVEQNWLLFLTLPDFVHMNRILLCLQELWCFTVAIIKFSIYVYTL